MYRSVKTKALGLQHALRVKSAELWLEVGQPEAALLELQKLPKRALIHPWAWQVFRTALATYAAFYPVSIQT